MQYTSYMGGVLSSTFECSPGYTRLTGIDTHGDFSTLCYRRETMNINNEIVSFITDIQIASVPREVSSLTFYITISCVICLFVLVLRR